ncbi:hypothetical protein HOK68_02735 [Candidatus Woesearchaeota archaeon]|jgi:adenylosuccinate synthase|nr:hypothetical protein [Candidatus Woesearchaeota archaeon]MBT4387113.1 hypothetical protein [Candidatus Woesearchaeota archaeon]MBT4596130.1 hypothetical protein [Candidatus Woesearchaeota archaeon]MBT5741647.1 hypothetical protein [Candidatus Woesearchaeota archaeon]MBT6505668.1 hypothetical protein [Candidatus Woesearchaeota archaeon]
MEAGGFVIISGMSFGDEGKIKESYGIMNSKSLFEMQLLKNNPYPQFDITFKCNGGANAGGTYYIDGKKCEIHQLPPGLEYKHLQFGIGSGCVVEPIGLTEEILNLKQIGVSLEGRLNIYGGCPLITPLELFLDAKSGGKIGTTGKGIGPAYSKRALRTDGTYQLSISISEYMGDKDFCMKQIKGTLSEFLIMNNTHLKKHEVDDKIEEFDEAVKFISQYVFDDMLYFQNQVDSGKNVLIINSNGACLDNHYGLMPNVTSSRTISSTAPAGANLNFHNCKGIIGIVKAIDSRVGNGPFVGEMGGIIAEEMYRKTKGYTGDLDKNGVNPYQLLESNDEALIGRGIRILTGEYGVTTGRPRAIGYLDLVRLKTMAKISGTTQLFINKIDCLQLFSHTKKNKIPVITHYRIGDDVTDQLPITNKKIRAVEPVFEYLDTFSSDITDCKFWDNLPKQAREFVDFVEEYVGIPVAGIGTGPANEQLLFNSKYYK